MNIKGKIFKMIENNEVFLKFLLIVFNKMQYKKNEVNISSIHFRNNELIITGGDNNYVNLDENSYLKNGKIWIKGEKNEVKLKDDTIVCGNEIKQTIHINGDNNKIIIGRNCRIDDSTLFIWGNDNAIIIEDGCSLMKTELHIEQSNNTIKIGNGCTFHGRDGYPIHIAADEGSSIDIDDDCMLANGIQIRSTDSHSIVNLQGERINPAKDVYIGKHCWIGLEAIILKGTKISSQTVVAAGWGM